MSFRSKGCDSELESLKMSCAVIDNMLSDIKREYDTLDEEYFTLHAHYQHLRELENGKQSDRQVQRRYLTDEELALFAGPTPSPRPTAFNNVTDPDPQPTHGTGEPVPGPSSRDDLISQEENPGYKSA